MGIFSKKSNGGGLMDVIRCDESSYLIWKWHPEGTDEGKNERENAIRWGSSLRVREGSVAVFVYKQPNGTQQEYIEGPFDDIIETKNFPVLASLIGLAYQGGSPFQAEIYFINLIQIVQIKFAVPFFDVYDPRFLDFGVPIAVRGSINFRIEDYKSFIRLHGLNTFSMEQLKSQIQDAVCRYVKEIVSNVPEENGIPVIQIERKISLINAAIEERVKKRLENEFGVCVSSLDVSALDIDKTSDGYRQLRRITQELTASSLQAQTDVNIKNLYDNQELDIMEKKGRIVSNIKEDAYARHKQTQTANIEAYHIEAQEHVGVAGSQGLGKMGASTGTNNGGVINPATMMTGMYVGSAIGQNIANSVNGLMNSVVVQNKNVTPPPINCPLYHLAVNGKPTGPYDIVSLRKLYENGKLTKESLLWTKGMATWEKAETIEKIQSIFVSTTNEFDDQENEIPPIPQT